MRSPARRHASSRGPAKTVSAIVTTTMPAVATVGMVVVTVSLTVFAGPLLDMCLRAGVDITDGVSLVQIKEQAGQG